MSAAHYKELSGAEMAAEYEQKCRFVFEAGKTLPPFCHKFVARVVAARKDGGWDHRGTALMIQFGERQGFVTALHVLSAIEKDENYRSFGFSPVAEGGYVDIRRFEDLDVAVVFLRAPISPKDGHEFWPIDRTDLITTAASAIRRPALPILVHNLY